MNSESECFANSRGGADDEDALRVFDTGHDEGGDDCPRSRILGVLPSSNAARPYFEQQVHA